MAARVTPQLGVLPARPTGEIRPHLDTIAHSTLAEVLRVQRHWAGYLRA
jgi:hypothetical protein